MAAGPKLLHKLGMYRATIVVDGRPLQWQYAKCMVAHLAGMVVYGFDEKCKLQKQSNGDPENEKNVTKNASTKFKFDDESKGTSEISHVLEGEISRESEESWQAPPSCPLARRFWTDCARGRENRWILKKYLRFLCNPISLSKF